MKVNSITKLTSNSRHEKTRTNLISFDGSAHSKLTLRFLLGRGSQLGGQIGVLSFYSDAFGRRHFRHSQRLPTSTLYMYVRVIYVYC